MICPCYEELGSKVMNLQQDSEPSSFEMRRTASFKDSEHMIRSWDLSKTNAKTSFVYSVSI